MRLVLPPMLIDQFVEFEEGVYWASSEAGQAAKMTNPAGFANVRAHAETHLRGLTQHQATVSSMLAAHSRP